MKQEFNKLVLHAIDSPRRDFEWRLFIAYKLARFGISSVISDKGTIKAIHSQSKNAWIFGRLASATSRGKDDQQWVKRFSPLGTKLFFLHDEGGLYFRQEYSENVRKIYPSELFHEKYLERVFFWGDAQVEQFYNDPSRGKFIISGSPRFDLSREEYDFLDADMVLSLKKKFGEFVLINTKFALANRVVDERSDFGQRSREIFLETGLAKDINEPRIYRKNIDVWRKVNHEFSEFLDAALKLILDFPTVNFVIRPHPAENSRIYTDLFDAIPNAFVDKAGDVRPFLRAAKLVIHSDCTTGLEAALSAKPVINFRPNVPGADLSVAGLDEIGLIVNDYRTLKNAVSRSLIDGKPTDIRGTDITRFIANASSNHPSASDIIIEEFVSALRRDPVPTILNMRPVEFFLCKRRLGGILRSAKALFKGFGGGGAVVRFRAQPKGERKLIFHDPVEVAAMWEKLGGERASLKIFGQTVWVMPSLRRSQNSDHLN